MIIQQPDGKWAMFSNISDTLLGFDMTKEELIEIVVERAAAKARWDIENSFEQLEKGLDVNFVFRSDMSFEEALKRHTEFKANCKDENWNSQVEQKLKEITDASEQK